jgi:hypothetical protein
LNSSALISIAPSSEGSGLTWTPNVRGQLS